VLSSLSSLVRHLYQPNDERSLAVSQRQKGQFQQKGFEKDGYSFDDLRKGKFKEEQALEVEYFNDDEIEFLDEAEGAIEKWIQRESRRSKAAEQRAKKAWQ